MSETVLVTGATGAIGHRVVHALHAAGYTLRTLSLDTPGPKLFPPEVDNLIGDVTDPMAVHAAMHGIDAVVHLAAQLHIANPPPELQEMFEKVNVGGTAAVAAAAEKAGVQRVIMASTIAVYGPAAGKILDEDSPARPDTLYAKTKLAAERIVLGATRPDGRALGTVLRFAAVYGGRVKGNYRRLIRALSRGCFVAVGDGSNRHTLIYDKDLAQAVVLALVHPAAAGQVFNVTDGRCHSLKEIIAAMCLALGRTPPRWSLPRKPVRWLAGLMDDAAKAIGHQSSIGRATIDKFTEDFAVSGDKIRHELGFASHYDLESGWRQTVAELRETGEL